MLVLFLFVFNVAQCAEKIGQEEMRGLRTNVAQCVVKPALKEVTEGVGLDLLEPYSAKELHEIWKECRGERSATANKKLKTMLYCLNARKKCTSRVEKSQTALLSAMLYCMILDRRYLFVQDSERPDTLRFDLSKYEYRSDGGSSLFEGGVESSDPAQVLFSYENMQNKILVTEKPSGQQCALVFQKYQKRLIYVNLCLEDLASLGDSLVRPNYLKC
ncbi:MAG: hypothetical protein OXC30_02950 [Alphaproteobacteria bacterium]|nr:hypothetical protein [Alphaproteobacteria bacterium]